MQKLILQISGEGEYQEVPLEDEISIGRTELATVVLEDSGLSRVNTTIFRDGGDVFIVDENSTNGTFVNGKRISGSPLKLLVGDEITLGNHTRILLKSADAKVVAATISPETEKAKQPVAKKKKQTAKSAVEEKKLPLIPIVAALSTVLIVFVAAIAIFLARASGTDTPGNKVKQIQPDIPIPVRVIDPLGHQDPDSIDDLIALLDQDIADTEVDSKDLEDLQTNITSTDTTGTKIDSELLVPVTLFKDMLAKSKEPRSPSGERPPGLEVGRELCCGVPKQKAKLEQMVAAGYRQPLDYADLAERRLNGDLLEIPVATNFYVLEVGGNATDAEFTQFSWDTTPRSTKMPTDSPKYKILQRLAERFKYDLGNPSHRKQMKIRLLRMFNKKAEPILMELAKAYHQKFNRPLRITSLTRSMEYQISLNGNNANSFKVSGEGSRPPHTSGCAFDLARLPMTTEEQNFMIKKLTELENRGVLDALIEYNKNSCFHVFIYDDGIKPKGF